MRRVAMQSIAAGIVIAIPLALAPGLFFYYDVTPKAGILLAAAAILLLWTAWKPQTSVVYWTSRFGRWNAVLAAAFILLTVAAAANSPSVSLAWNGSNWRRWGAVEQIATVVCALLVASIARSAPSCRLVILRALCCAGVVAAVYGILQYFGFDPLLQSATYLVGEGSYQIVRPPGPLGHSDYFAAFLLWPIFAGSALWIADSRPWRWLGAAAVLTGVVALILAGSRGALLGLFAGSVVLMWQRRTRIRLVAVSLAILVTVAAAFYVSPAGARLRARAFWISEDPTGGARLLLWRDSARMSAGRLSTGFGSDTFVAEFPQYESAELARAYPDFYHESPHNIFLDALSGQGAGGVVLLAIWIVIGVAAGLRAPPEMRPVAGALLAGLIATVVAQQFVVFVIPTAFLFFLGVGLLSGLEPGASDSISMPLRSAFAVACTAAAVVLGITGYRLVAADVTLSRLRAALDAGNRAQATLLWETAKTQRSSGVTADLYFSRRWADAASKTQDPLEKLRLSALVIESARLATTMPEQRQNAWYNFAMLAAAMNDSRTVESSLRAAIQAGPQWFKPHWALARLVYSAGRTDEAREEAALALDLDGHKNAEVVETMGKILRSLDSRR
jgi:O-antigen ligase